MEQVLQEYGQVLVLRPFEIHYFNIDFAFSKGKLAELYGQFGNVDAREKSSRFEIFDHRRRPAREVPPHRRLQCDVEVLRRSMQGVTSIFGAQKLGTVLKSPCSSNQPAMENDFDM